LVRHLPRCVPDLKLYCLSIQLQRADFLPITHTDQRQGRIARTQTPRQRRVQQAGRHKTHKETNATKKTRTAIRARRHNARDQRPQHFILRASNVRIETAVHAAPPCGAKMKCKPFSSFSRRSYRHTRNSLSGYLRAPAHPCLCSAQDAHWNPAPRAGRAACPNPPALCGRRSGQRCHEGQAGTLI
jgi:hypothetical protein